LGKIKSLGYNGKLIIRGEFSPRVSQKVLDNSMAVIGTISRVFGPVGSPFITVKPQKDRPITLDMVGRAVYVDEKSKK
jgi:rRNA processing protein Gar1